MVDQGPDGTGYAGEHGPVVGAEKAFLGLRDKDSVFGLALSGGGIRSASFALGVLQALYGYGVFGKFHYLSTVSGGGYIGAALTYFRRVFAFQDQADPDSKVDWFPFGYLRSHDGTKVRAIGARTAKPEEPANLRAFEIVSFLRQHASFLTPSRKLDRPALAAGVIRGLISTVLPYMAILAGIFGVLLALRAFDYRISLDGYQHVLALLVGSAPPIYLALLPAGAAGLIVAAVLASALWQVRSSSKASAGREVPAKSLERYMAGIERLWLSGLGLLIAAALFILALLPWLRDFLSNLPLGGETPTTLTALFAALGGGWAQVAKLRAIIGGNERPPSAWKSLMMVIAGIAFVLGVVLLAYIIGFDVARLSLNLAWPWLSWMPGWLATAAAAIALPLVMAIIGWRLAIKINVNHANQHRLYRDRLVEVFCAEQTALKDCLWYPAQVAQGSLGWLQHMTIPGRPYHLINTALVTTDSENRRYRGRGADNFVLSPLYSGSDATGWAKTETCMSAVSIATAAAVSGAALNAHTGPHGSGGLRNKAYAALLSFLGLNLGYWARNPKKFKTSNPEFSMPNLIKPGFANISGWNLDEEGDYVQLSDGGHFENLAIYELIRRKVKFLCVSDAGQDTKFSFEDLSSAIERVRVDFGVNIRFYDQDYDLTHLLPKSAITDSPASKNFAEEYKLAKRGYAIGTIEYPPEENPDGTLMDLEETNGTILYIKSTLTRFLPGDIYGYKARNDDFPHQTTLDQFFDEEQFEAYRELGYRLTARLFRDIEDAGKAGAPSLAPSLAKIAKILGL